MPIDMIVQRDRTYRTADDVSKQIASFQRNLAELDQQFVENGGDNPATQAMLAALHNLANAMQSYSQTEAAQKALESAGFFMRAGGVSVYYSASTTAEGQSIAPGETAAIGTVVDVRFTNLVEDGWVSAD
jgi:cysteinyl-tRNA synthetase